MSLSNAPTPAYSLGCMSPSLKGVRRIVKDLLRHLLVEKCSSCIDSRLVYNEEEEGQGERRQFLSDESVESS